MTSKQFHVSIIAIGLTSFGFRWMFRHEMAVWVSDIGRDVGMSSWALGMGHMLFPVFILGYMATSALRLIQEARLDAPLVSGEITEMVGAGILGSAIWVITLVAIMQLGIRSHNAFPTWYLLQGAAALIGILLAGTCRRDGCRQLSFD